MGRSSRSRRRTTPLRIDHAAARDRSLENVRKITIIVTISILAGCLVIAALLNAADPSLAATPAGARSDASWTILRAAGAVDLALLTLAVGLGVAVLPRSPVGGAPRAVFVLMHRNVSLLSVALLVAHVVAAVVLLHLDAIRSLVPFTSHVRRGYLGLGVLSADIMVLLAATSVVRVRLGLKQWRQLHWGAYPAWVAAVVHGAAPGTDRLVPWVGWLDVLCVVAVLGAASVRFAQFARDRPMWLLGAGAAAAFALVGFVSWVNEGQQPAMSGDHDTPVTSPSATQTRR